MARQDRKTRQTKPEWDPMGNLVANAVDFLRLATEQFDAHPKHSVIAFHSAVELFLKARLMEEHWTLAVGKNADLSSFKKGDFVSVSFEEACDRLKKIIDSPLPERMRTAFDKVRRHRNRLVHFFQDITDPVVREQIAVEQLAAWHGLRILLEGQWCDVFARFEIDLESLNRNFAVHRHYLKTRFESLTDRIAELVTAGKTVVTCEQCGYLASEERQKHGELFESDCLVCGSKPLWLQLECANCDKEYRARGGESATCVHCGEVYGASDIAEQIDDDPVTYDNYYDHHSPGNCSYCDGYETIVSFHGKYICVSCLELTSDLSACGWCGTGNNGDMTGSDWRGCNFCDGRRGWEND